MLSRKHRIVNRKAIPYILNKGSKLRGEALLCKYIMKETKENLDLNIPQEVRLAFLISKKIDKKAHNRNRLKRQLSEMAGLFLKQYNGFKKSFDIVILPLSGIHSKTFQDLDRDLNNLLSQITSHKYYEKTNY